MTCKLPQSEEGMCPSCNIILLVPVLAKPKETKRCPICGVWSSVEEIRNRAV